MADVAVPLYGLPDHNIQGSMSSGPLQWSSESSSQTSITSSRSNYTGVHSAGRMAFCVDSTGIVHRGGLSSRELWITSGDAGGNGEGTLVGNRLAAMLAAALRRLTCGAAMHTTVPDESTPRSFSISWPSNVQHISHVTFDRHKGFLGLPSDFAGEIRRVPSASASVFGVSPDCLQCSYDDRGNSIPSILLLMQKRLYTQGGLTAEGIFRLTAENDQEETVREQVNRGELPGNMDVHCIAGLMKAWFRELPYGVLDTLTPDQVAACETEEQCVELVRSLPNVQRALMDWAIGLMADIAEHEVENKMNARNVAMVFSPNMTQVDDPLTALMHAVQVMNFLKALILRRLRERQEGSAPSHPWAGKPSNMKGGDMEPVAVVSGEQDGSLSGSYPNTPCSAKCNFDCFAFRTLRAEASDVSPSAPTPSRTPRGFLAGDWDRPIGGSPKCLMMHPKDFGTSPRKGSPHRCLEHNVLPIASPQRAPRMIPDGTWRVVEEEREESSIDDQQEPPGKPGIEPQGEPARLSGRIIARNLLLPDGGIVEEPVSLEGAGSSGGVALVGTTAVGKVLSQIGDRRCLGLEVALREKAASWGGTGRAELLERWAKLALDDADASAAAQFVEESEGAKPASRSGEEENVASGEEAGPAGDESANYRGENGFKAPIQCLDFDGDGPSQEQRYLQTVSGNGAECQLEEESVGREAHEVVVRAGGCVERILKESQIGRSDATVRIEGSNGAAGEAVGAGVGANGKEGGKSALQPVAEVSSPSASLRSGSPAHTTGSGLFPLSLIRHRSSGTPSERTHKAIRPRAPAEGMGDEAHSSDSLRSWNKAKGHVRSRSIEPLDLLGYLEESFSMKMDRFFQGQSGESWMLRVAAASEGVSLASGEVRLPDTVASSRRIKERAEVEVGNASHGGVHGAGSAALGSTGRYVSATKSAADGLAAASAASSTVPDDGVELAAWRRNGFWFGTKQQQDAAENRPVSMVDTAAWLAARGNLDAVPMLEGVAQCSRPVEAPRTGGSVLMNGNNDSGAQVANHHLVQSLEDLQPFSVQGDVAQQAGQEDAPQQAGQTTSGPTPTSPGASSSRRSSVREYVFMWEQQASTTSRGLESPQRRRKNLESPQRRGSSPGFNDTASSNRNPPLLNWEQEWRTPSPNMGSTTDEKRLPSPRGKMSPSRKSPSRKSPSRKSPSQSPDTWQESHLTHDRRKSLDSSSDQAPSTSSQWPLPRPNGERRCNSASLPLEGQHRAMSPSTSVSSSRTKRIFEERTHSTGSDREVGSDVSDGTRLTRDNIPAWLMQGGMDIQGGEPVVGARPVEGVCAKRKERSALTTTGSGVAVNIAENSFREQHRFNWGPVSDLRVHQQSRRTNRRALQP